MDPREDDDSLFDESDESDENELVVRELEAKLARLQAELDQLTAAARERGEETAELRARMDELELLIARLRRRYRWESRMWGWIGLFAGGSIGLWISWLLR